MHHVSLRTLCTQRGLKGKTSGNPPFSYTKITSTWEGKGRLFCLGGGGGIIYSIPRRASCFVLDDFNYRVNCTRMI